jgi:hypothetical protein
MLIIFPFVIGQDRADVESVDYAVKVRFLRITASHGINLTYGKLSSRSVAAQPAVGSSCIADPILLSAHP